MVARLPITASRFSSALKPRADADHHDPAAGAQSALRLSRQVRGADQLEHHVERAVVAEALGIDRGGAELLDLGRSSSLRTVAVTARARRPAELDRRRAHAAGAAVHQQVLARAQRRPG